MVPFLPTLTPVKMAWCLLNIWTASFSHWGTVAKERWVKLGTPRSKAGDSSPVLHHVTATALATCHSLTSLSWEKEKERDLEQYPLLLSDSFYLLPLISLPFIQSEESILCQKHTKISKSFGSTKL